LPSIICSSRVHSKVSATFSATYSNCQIVVVRVPSPTGDSTQVVGMRGRGQGSAVAEAVRWRRGGESTAAARWNSRLLEEAGNKSLISLPLFRMGDYIFIVLGLYQ
jgi:hypothetical protein